MAFYLFREDFRKFWRGRPKPVSWPSDPNRPRIYLFDTQPGFHRGTRFVYTDHRYVPHNWIGML